MSDMLVSMAASGLALTAARATLALSLPALLASSLYVRELVLNEGTREQVDRTRRMQASLAEIRDAFSDRVTYTERLLRTLKSHDADPLIRGLRPRSKVWGSAAVMAAYLLVPIAMLVAIHPTAPEAIVRAVKACARAVARPFQGQQTSLTSALKMLAI